MDLLILRDAPARHGDLSLKACIATHRPFIGGDRVAILRHDGTARGIVSVLRNALSDGDSEDVCVTSDTIMVVDGIDPWLAHAFRHSMYLKRKGAFSDAMVSTIGILLENGMSTFDFEPMVPLAAKRSDLIASLALAEGPVLWRTLHHNRMGNSPVRTDDPMMPVWKYNYEPKVPSLALSDTCYANPDCLTWLRKAACS